MATDVKNMPEHELAGLERAIAERRTEEAAAKAAEKERLRVARARVIEELVTEEFVNLFQPEHQRTSCSDKNLDNGYGSHSSGGYRCLRCALLQAVRYGETYRLRLTIE